MCEMCSQCVGVYELKLDKSSECIFLFFIVDCRNGRGLDYGNIIGDNKKTYYEEAVSGEVKSRKQTQRVKKKKREWKGRRLKSEVAV